MCLRSIVNFMAGFAPEGQGVCVRAFGCVLGGGGACALPMKMHSQFKVVKPGSQRSMNYVWLMPPPHLQPLHSAGGV